MRAATSLPHSAEPAPASAAGMGLYFHIPFCLRKCPYCAFFSVPVTGRDHRRYVMALRRRIVEESAVDPAGPVSSIFFGGGTPSLLGAENLAMLLAECLRRFRTGRQAVECSIEVNPATVGEGDLRQLVRAGFSRLSIGVQSFVDEELRLLGRPHDAAAAHAVIKAARRAGFANINLDLMYGLPGQTVSAWRGSLDAALAHEPEHLAIYELTVEAGTPFAGLREQGALDLPREEAVLAMMELTRQLTGQAGLRRYEISNYARPGLECRHNINYWHNGDYLGFGAGAVASLAGCRRRAVEDLDRFCEAVEQGAEVWAEVETLDPEARFRETVIMGLRMTAGVSLSELRERFGLDPLSYYGETLTRLRDQGLIVATGEWLRLSEKGLLLANRVMAELV